MKTKLPPAIAGFFQAHNSGETGEFPRLFTSDARVSDEHQEYRGSAIKAWLDGAVKKYRPSAEIIAVDEVGDTTVVRAQVSGDFPGSPAEISYRFVLKGDQIFDLKIG